MALQVLRKIRRTAVLSLPPSFLKTSVQLVAKVPWISIGELELRLLPHLAAPLREAVDVGANRGIYSILLERLVGPQRLVLFEPVPDLHRHLLRLFPAARVFDTALSNASGPGELRIPVVAEVPRPARATLEPGVSDSTQYIRIPVQQRSLDDYVADGSLSDVGFLKIDVEGHELSVLEGATKLLSTFQPNIVVEIEQRHHSFPVERIFEFIEDLGYRVYFLERMSRRLIGRSAFSAERHQPAHLDGSVSYIQNFVCIHSTTPTPRGL